MASSVFSCMQNPIKNSAAAFTAEPISVRNNKLEFPSMKQTLSSNNLISTHTNYLQPSINNTDYSPTKSSSSTIGRQLSTSWREIQGSNNWRNLVGPTLDPLLRQEIVRYGEFVAACYKAFDLDPSSRRYLSCKYGKGSIFERVGLEDHHSGYEVTKYVYATAPGIHFPTQPETHTRNPNKSRWVGYVAASSDNRVNSLGRRDIVIAFRGTVTSSEWIANLMSSLKPAHFDPHDPRADVRVEAGFLSLYTSDESGSKFGLGSLREQLLSEVSRLVEKYKGEEISITIAGHSMGSSLALLLAYDIAELGLNVTRPNKEYSGKGNIPVTVFSFGGPRVGNSGFKERCEELGIKVLRVVNVNDPITNLPGFVFNENLFKGFSGGGYEFPNWRCSCYTHVGVELVLDFFKMENPSCVHDLENYIIGLLKSCPNYKSSCNNNSKSDRDQDHDYEWRNLMERAKGFLSVGAQRFDGLQWRINAAMDVFNLVQSQWT
ncbi:hypothetical protein ABFS82_14G042300 [Erythranthe guttata]|nr:PREDICTED: galactolipase DONGLE, chloroplastic-like [Erythranthe guttata]|eukprot:XP_012843155.1 PREDICTED: galactolipase DONGLE, chloroplastic-like [Erythranthe guttata]